MLVIIHHQQAQTIYGGQSSIFGTGDLGWLQSPGIVGPGLLFANQDSLMVEENVSHS